jgi:MoxR-like ATPase
MTNTAITSTTSTTTLDGAERTTAPPEPGTGIAAAEIAAAKGLVDRLESRVAGVVRGKPEVIRLAVVALLSDGHILIEDVPGVGKTTLAQSLARAVGLAFQRIQFTSDLLPSDIIGVSIFNQKKQAFEFVPGPIFSNIVLADEINRATPKTQSALLEAMSEGKVSVERKRYVLPRPFLVMATQNPLEYQGTFPLPESQLDRFLMSLNMGYPPREDERQLLLSGGVDDLLEHIEPALDGDGLLALQGLSRQVRVAEKLVDYILGLAEETRESREFAMPISTRGVQSLYRATQALALCEGRDYAVPDDVQRLAVPVLGHRVMLRRGTGGLEETQDAIRHVVASIPVPV